MKQEMDRGPVALFRFFFSDKVMRIVSVLLLAFLLLIFIGQVLVPWSPVDSDFMNRNKGPGMGHLAGTDSMGRDSLARCLSGGRISVLIGLAGMLCALLLGGIGGAVASAIGGPVKALFFGMVDLIRSMPGPLLAITLVVSMGEGTIPVIIALGFMYSPMYARMSRSLYSREISMDYVHYSMANKAPKLWILARHILPNMAGAFITQSAIVFPRAIVTESVLSFLGMGVSPETPTWGKMISIESAFFESNPIAVLAPVIFLSVFTALFAVLGTRLREKS